MKFSILKSDFATYLNLLTPIVDKTDIRPAAANLKVIVKKDYIKLETLNLTSSLEANIKVGETIEVEEEGGFTVSAAKLAQLVKSLDKDTKIEFEAEEDWINIYADNSKFKLFTLKLENFPDYEILEDNFEVEIKKEDFKNLLNLTVFSIANVTKEIREFMKGLLLEFDENELKAVSTDGHRLSYAKLAVNLDKKLEANNNKFIVPERSAQDFLKLLAIIEDETIKLKLAKNQIQLKSEEFTYKSKLILAEYAAYKEIIPKSNSIELVVEVEKLKRSLNKISFLANEHKQIVHFFIENQKLFLKAENREKEKAEDELDVVFSTDSEYEISFNYIYITDILNKTTEEEKKIYFYLNPVKEKSVLIKKEKDENFIYIVMPTKN